MRAITLFVLCTLVLWASHAEAKSKKGHKTSAEVEIYASLSGDGHAAGYVLFATKEPCDPASALTIFGSTHVKKLGSAFVEIFVPQGTLIHICGAALDKDNNVTAWGKYEANPVKGQGDGEVLFTDVMVHLLPLARPVPMPAGL